MNVRIFILFLVLSSSLHAQVFVEDFESGNGSISSTTGTYCNDGSADYFEVNNDPGFGGNFTGNASNFFGAQDIDECGGNGGTESISWTGIDISSCTGLSLSVDLAEDDDGSNEDWDASDFVHFDVSIDGGAYFPVLWIENDGNTFNSPPYLDTDFNGTGNVSGANEITDTWQNFTAAIAGTGASLDLRITFALNSGDEDIAIDNITITGPGCVLAPPEDCTNGVDDDGDGLIDCADGDCTGNPACIESNCSDGIDNDGDGNIDCDDSDCSGAPGCPENNCSDGVDNDGDGQVDCLDLDCDADVACNPTSCIDGAIGVPCGGCLNGCDLTSLGGPNCSPPVSGNCSSPRWRFMSALIFVPDGCTYTVNATMRPRPGCSSSGADGNCATCDRMKVDIQGGGKPVQFGGSNSTLNDSYTLVGPGYIEVSGGADRSDEIITWTITPSGALCPNCQSVLPVELRNFRAIRMKNNDVQLSWATTSEVNSDYFLVERSTDGEFFEMIGAVNALQTSSQFHQYHLMDTDPINHKVSYYRLKQVDLDGNYTYSSIVSVKPLEQIKIIGYYNALGQEIPENSKGVVIVRYSDGTTERKYNP